MWEQLTSGSSQNSESPLEPQVKKSVPRRNVKLFLICTPSRPTGCADKGAQANLFNTQGSRG